MRPISARFYLTYRCHATCEFCSIWQRSDRDFEIEIEEVFLILKALKRLKVSYLVFDGGEPLLRSDILPILKRAHTLGFKTLLLTDGIKYPKLAEEMKGLLQEIRISLDSAVALEHNRIRGGNFYDQALFAIKTAQEFQENVSVNFTLTRNELVNLPEMVSLAESLRVKLRVNPVFDYQDLFGFSKEAFDYLKYYFKHPLVVINLAKLEFLKKGGNQRFHKRCRVVDSLVTVSPRGELILPCFYNPHKSIKIEDKNDLVRFYRDFKSLKSLRLTEGNSKICQNCVRWPMIENSFWYRLDKYFLLSLYSKIKEVIKR